MADSLAETASRYHDIIVDLDLENARLKGAALTDQDIYYLRSIYRQLRQVMLSSDDLSLGGEVLADNVNWLDCFIEKQERHHA